MTAPRLLRSRTTFPAAVLLLVFAGVFATAPSASAAPALTASPSTGLADGALVHVHASGLTPGQLAVVTECHVATAFVENCQALSLGPADADGSLAVTVRIFAVVATEAGPVDCRTSNTCVLDAYEAPGTLGSFTPVPLSFEPTAPLGSAPTFTATPSTGAHAGDTITLAGSGLNADADMPVFRCNPTIVQGSLSCDTSPTGGTTVHTDAAGSFVATIPLVTTFSTDAFTGGFPPTTACTTASCIVYALVPALPFTASTAAVDFVDAPVSTTTSTTAISPVQPPAAPVVVTPSFTG